MIGVMGVGSLARNLLNNKVLKFEQWMTISSINGGNQMNTDSQITRFKAQLAASSIVAEAIIELCATIRADKNPYAYIRHIWALDMLDHAHKYIYKLR